MIQQQQQQQQQKEQKNDNNNKQTKEEEETKVLTELNQAPTTGRGRFFFLIFFLVMADITQFFHVTVSVSSFT